MGIVEQLKQVADNLGQLSEDTSVPRNIRRGAKECIQDWLLDDKKELDIRIFSVINKLEALADDPNIPMHGRTMIYMILNQLENINNQLADT